ncbi:hypothetical protein Taro_038192, partial [Colocasia esculenta]|nr:hypothetical protein [Colocasia esculenta]
DKPSAAAQLSPHAMDVSTAAAPVRLAGLPPRAEGRPYEPSTEALKQRLLRGGVVPTPKILHALRKKEIQKGIRRSKKRALEAEEPPVSESQRHLADEETLFRTISTEYRAVREELRRRNGGAPASSVLGKPWERSHGVELRGSASVEFNGGRLKGEHLNELAEILSERNSGDLRWLLDNDVEELPMEDGNKTFLPGRMSREEDKIRFLVKGLTSKNLTIQDWKFSRLMKLSGLLFTEKSLLRIVDELGARENWRQALDVVEWVYSEKNYKHHKSRFVYTKLLAVLGKARKSAEALRVFNTMREDCEIYPDMAAYHSIAVTLGQAGLVKELIGVIECMKQKPPRRLKNMRRKNWDPCLQPDVIIYNAVLNACAPSRQWKGVFWVLGQMRSGGLKPNAATYGLAMEVYTPKYLLSSPFYAHGLFWNLFYIIISGLALKALSYKILVRAFWKEGKIDEAIDAVRDMEQRGVVGATGVYYELACCLCNNGRWKEAMLEFEKLKRLPLRKPLEVAFTGMIQSSMDGGHFHDSISIFEHMKDYCAPNIGTINVMLKVYARNDMFAKAKYLFEAIKGNSSSNASSCSSISLSPDAYSYHAMLEASASAHQWEYFEYLYKEMTLYGHKLNLGRHVWFLVDASRAGKWHLLEHAFDAILEDGEVPHVSLFTEMVCQNVARQNYEGAVLLVNSMAHASFEVSEQQWIDLLKRSCDRISQDKLQMFLKCLEDSATVEEAPVSSLLKSLKSICRPRLSTAVPRITASTDAEKETSASCEDGAEVEKESNRHRYLPSLTGMLKDDVEESDDESFAFPQINGSGGGIQFLLEGEVDKEASDFSADCSIEETDVSNLHDSSEASITESTLDMLTNHIDLTSTAKMPSASEILSTWMEERKEDGLFPFQL